MRENNLLLLINIQFYPLMLWKCALDAKWWDLFFGDPCLILFFFVFTSPSLDAFIVSCLVCLEVVFPSSCRFLCKWNSIYFAPIKVHSMSACSASFCLVTWWKLEREEQEQELESLSPSLSLSLSLSLVFAKKGNLSSLRVHVYRANFISFLSSTKFPNPFNVTFSSSCSLN